MLLAPPRSALQTRVVLLLGLTFAYVSSEAVTATGEAPSSAHASVKAATNVKWGDIPLSFEPNVGQESPEVRHLARGSSYALYLTDTEIVLSGHHQAPLRMKLLGANVAPRIVGENQQASKSNYLVGNDPSKWRTAVPNYGRTRYRERLSRD